MIDVVTAKKLAEKYKKLYGKSIILKREITGFTPPSNLITSINYPKVSLGVLTSYSDDIYLYDNPTFWARYNIPEEEIIKSRVSLINAKRIVEVNLPKKNDRLYENILEAMLSTKSINIELYLKKIIENGSMSKIIGYYGYSGIFDNIKVNENPKIPNEIYKINDMKSEDSVYYLYKEGMSDYYISRLFSIGFFGYKINKRLVPSKWSITAVHSIIEKKIKEEIKDKIEKVDKYYLFYYSLYGNDFYGILLPGNGNVELIETLIPGSIYNLHGKYYIIGRDDTSGGYYALRLSFAEFMKNYKLKGDLVVFRFVTPNYKIPLGVWVVREGTKYMLNNMIEKFNNYNEFVDYINNKFHTKYNISYYRVKKYSNILKQTILDFLR
ncbi:DNA repair protein NreA [Nanoarchaeota archaeon]